VAAASARRRVEVELAAIEELARANPGRVELRGLREAAGQVLALAATLHVRTSVLPEACTAPELRHEQVRVEIALPGYPATPPKVCLASRSRLYLPGVAVFGPLGDEYAGVPCLYRGAWDPTRMELPFLLLQAHAALVAAPEVLNSPADCLNRPAARHFLARRSELPLDAPLELPATPAPAPSRSRRFHAEVE
jgi:hypothetical protein